MKNLTEEREAKLRKEAEKRVEFKNHFMIYVVVIAFLWVIWALTGSGYAWPIWPTAGWGIGIFFHYVSVYNPFNLFSVEKEMEKLKKKSE